MESYKLISWIEEDQLSSIRTSEYWNNSKIEKNKVFHIAKGQIEKLHDNQHLNDIYDHLSSILDSERLSSLGNVLSLAAGTCWLEGRILSERDFKYFTGVDFSKHRIHGLGPIVLGEYNLDPENCELVFGSFLDLKMDDKSQDVIILSQAFHHTNEPVKLLQEVKRVLSDQGIVVIVGEHYYAIEKKISQIFVHFIKYINNKGFRKKRTFFPDYKQLFPASFKKGDIHYSKFEYFQMFNALDFIAHRDVHKSRTIQSYILKKPEFK